MKKSIIVLSLLVSSTVSNAQSTWSLGITGSTLGNYSKFSGGMTDADARFHHNEYGTGYLGFVARKTLCPHWSFQTGFGFSSIGFDFAIAQNYSFLNRDGQYIGTNVSSSTVNIPASIIYNTNLNCRNWRWFIGGGFSTVMSGQTVNSTAKASSPEDNSAVILEQNFYSSAFTTINGHLIGGIEKVFKNQSVLSWGLIFNGGTRNLASTDVIYTLDGKTYNHTFTNRGNYFGCYVSYLFRPLGSKKASKEAK